MVVAIDYHSGFPKVLLTKYVTSNCLIQWLRDIFARFGNPAILVSDNGPQMRSDEFENFLTDRDILSGERLSTTHLKMVK